MITGSDIITARCHKSKCNWHGLLENCKAYPNTAHIDLKGHTEYKTAYYCPKCGWGLNS